MPPSSYRSQIPFNTHDPFWFLIADCCNVRWWVGRRLSREMPLLNLLLKPLFPPVQYWLAPKGSELGDDNGIVYVGLYVVTKLTCYLLGCLYLSGGWVIVASLFLFYFYFFSVFETEGNKPTPMVKGKRGKSCTSKEGISNRHVSRCDLTLCSKYIRHHLRFND